MTVIGFIIGMIAGVHFSTEIKYAYNQAKSIAKRLAEDDK